MDQLKKIPVIIRLNPKAIYTADLEADLRIDDHRINKELSHQASRYMWWSALYAEVAMKVDILEDRLSLLEAKLFRAYQTKGIRKQYDIKRKIQTNERFILMKARLRRWKKAEAQLKSAKEAFTQRANLLQTKAANLRQERKESDRG